jgi:putative FmdB family regulatory protein
VPVYVFRCDDCDREHDVLRKVGDVSPPECPHCGGPTHKKFGRVAVKYDAFGFTSTDTLVNDPRGRDMKALRAKAEQISDS